MTGSADDRWSSTAPGGASPSDIAAGPAPTSRREASTSACPAYRGNKLTAIVTGPMKTIAASTCALSSSLLTVVTSVVVSAQLKLTLARLPPWFQEG